MGFNQDGSELTVGPGPVRVGASGARVNSYTVADSAYYI